MGQIGDERGGGREDGDFFFTFRIAMAGTKGGRKEAKLNLQKS
jgi:hypothetical protein